MIIYFDHYCCSTFLDADPENIPGDGGGGSAPGQGGVHLNPRGSIKFDELWFLSNQWYFSPKYGYFRYRRGGPTGYKGGGSTSYFKDCYI